MFNRYKFSEARQRFTHLIDEVQQSKLQVIKKRKQNEKDAILLDIETQKFLLKPFGFNLEVLTEENNSTTLAINELDVFVNSASFDEALSELIDELILYGEEYLQNLPLYKQSPNRKGHLPYIFRIMLAQGDREEIREMILENA